MRHKRRAINLLIGLSIAFLGSFILSYNLSNRGFFDFGQYMDNLRKISQSTKTAFAKLGKGNESEVEADEESTEGEKALDPDLIPEVENIVYSDLSEYEGKNPYSTLLSDRAIVRDMRYLLGADGYMHFVKSIPNAKEVYYDKDSGVYTVKGKVTTMNSSLAGIVQIKDRGQIYIAYVLDNSILYYTNDKKAKKKTVENTQMQEWIDANKSDREIVFVEK